MTDCRYCLATIRFVKLDTGASIPVDPIAQPDRGTVAAKVQGRDLAGYVMSQTKPLQPGYSRYVVHRASCKPDKPKVTADQRAASLFDA